MFFACEVTDMNVDGFGFDSGFTRRSIRFGLALCLAVPAVSVVHAAESPAIKVYAAGSLRDAMGTLERAYADERRSAAPTQPIPTFQFLFGPSGKLREKIEAGEAVHVFASASPSHTERLVRAGKLRSSSVFASNSLCVIARPDFPISESNLIDTLLVPDVVLGTSTPGADPAGDYTWDMFKKIDAARPGAFATLDAKAKKLTGAEVNVADAAPPYARILVEKRADVFVTYCTNARAAQKIEPKITSVKVPAAFDVATSYALGITPEAPDAAREFLRYMLSQRAQKVMAEFGFSAPALVCSKVEPALNEAHAAWTGARLNVNSSAGAAPDAKMPTVQVGKRLAMSLQPADTLKFRRRTSASAGGGKVSFGGAAEFTPATGGHLEVFLDQRAWIDVVRIQDQTAAVAVRSDRWLGCAGVGKNLGFNVSAGERYELRLSEIDGAHAAVLLMLMPQQSSGSSATPTETELKVK